MNTIDELRGNIEELSVDNALENIKNGTFCEWLNMTRDSLLILTEMIGEENGRIFNDCINDTSNANLLDEY